MFAARSDPNFRANRTVDFAVDVIESAPLACFDSKSQEFSKQSVALQTKPTTFTKQSASLQTTPTTASNSRINIVRNQILFLAERLYKVDSSQKRRKSHICCIFWLVAVLFLFLVRLYTLVLVLFFRFHHAS